MELMESVRDELLSVLNPEGNNNGDNNLVHLIFDYQFLYYKYKFALDSGRMKRLTYPVEQGGVRVERDISQIYYSIREIESIRKKIQNNGFNVITSICFDSPSLRVKVDDTDATEKDTVKKTEIKKAVENYKANRVKSLNEEDFYNIGLVYDILTEAGYATYKQAGIEADDLVHHLVLKLKDAVDSTMVVTCDLDLGVLIDKKVSLYRFKSTTGYGFVSMNNWNDTVCKELKAEVPFNAIMLYKATVGDKSDNIQGIYRFGPSAFNKLVDFINSKDSEFDWEACSEVEGCLKALDICAEYLKPEQLEQAKASLMLVKPIRLETTEHPEEVKIPWQITTTEKRSKAYMKLGMQSLV